MARHPPDVLFVPAHVVPAIHPPTVVTIHDLGYLYEPDSHTPRDLLRLNLTTRWSARAAIRVITPSEATKRDLTTHLHVDPSRIAVIPHGVDERFSAMAQPIDDAIRHRLGVPPRYILTVGTIQPRKNLPVLARAIAALDRYGSDIHLVVCGKRGWRASQVVADLDTAGLGRKLKVLEYVEDHDLPAVYRGALAFCLPSRFEGFGLPVLEALASGVPTVVSDRGALPEIAGNAALIADADSSDDFARALRRIVEDEPMVRRLKEAGLHRATRFAWSITAARTLSLLREVADSR